jgi:hypothetical protein
MNDCIPLKLRYCPTVNPSQTANPINLNHPSNRLIKSTKVENRKGTMFKSGKYSMCMRKTMEVPRRRCHVNSPHRGREESLGIMLPLPIRRKVLRKAVAIPSLRNDAVVDVKADMTHFLPQSNSASHTFPLDMARGKVDFMPTPPYRRCSLEGSRHALTVAGIGGRL